MFKSVILLLSVILLSNLIESSCISCESCMNIIYPSVMFDKPCEQVEIVLDLYCELSVEEISTICLERDTLISMYQLGDNSTYICETIGICP